MYIMQLSSSCFAQLSCTLSHNPCFLNVLLTSLVKPGTETVSLSLFHSLQISSWPEKFHFYFIPLSSPWFPLFSPSRSFLTEWQSLLWSKQDADLACSGRAVPSLKLQTGLCRIKLGYLYPRRRDTCLFRGFRWWSLTSPLPITKSAVPFQILLKCWLCFPPL